MITIKYKKQIMNFTENEYKDLLIEINELWINELWIN